MRIAHLSDVHFGRLTDERIVPALVDDVNDAGVDLVAFSGDLTQRALPEQFKAAAEMIASLDAPTLVVPGNHDVYAWWHNPFKRVMSPVARFRSYISEDLMPTYEADGVAVLGLNSAHGKTVKGGRIRTRALNAMEDFFSEQAPSTFKVLVVHHHLTKLKALGQHDVARKARQALDAAGRVGVDLILCGHLHISHIEPVEIVPGAHRIVIASAGTATSNRGRKAHQNANFYNLIHISPEHFTVEERRYQADTFRFEEESTTEFKR
jgi:3',5'-cyclic AMP phosphodiesterase CpdA